MKKYITLAVDAMSGDHPGGIKEPIKAALKAVKQFPCLTIILIGDQAALEQELSRYRYDDERLRVYHADEVVTMSDTYREARRKVHSSLAVTLEFSRQDVAEVVISCANTIALIGLSQVYLERIKKGSDPALATLWPTHRPGRRTLLLDSGAALVSSPEQMYLNALMGKCAYEALFGGEADLRLLTVGVEDIKGTEKTKQVHQLLKERNFPGYLGKIEANQLYSGETDVILCEGEVGNNIVKVAPATKDLVLHFFKGEHWLEKALFAPSLPLLLPWFLLRRRRYQELNLKYGGILLGLKKQVIKCHGASNAQAIYGGILTAMRVVEKDLPSRLEYVLNGDA